MASFVDFEERDYTDETRMSYISRRFAVNMNNVLVMKIVDPNADLPFGGMELTLEDEIILVKAFDSTNYTYLKNVYAACCVQIERRFQ